MTKRERIDAALSGGEVDRVPVCFWHHFFGDEIAWNSMAEAHYRYFKEFDFDFIKIMNDNPYVDTRAGRLEGPADFRRLGKVDLAGTSMAPAIGGVRKLRELVGADVHLVCTVFGPYAAVDRLTGRRGPEFVAADPDGMREGLKRIAENLADFCREVVEAGADGIFLSVQGSRGIFPEGQYAELFRPFDLEVCDAVKDAPFNILHICGEQIDFDNFLDYPFQAFNWADRTAGPSLAEAREKSDRCFIGGVAHVDFAANAPLDELREQVRDAISQAGRRKYIVGGGCSVPNDIAPERLIALRDAAREPKQ